MVILSGVENLEAILILGGMHKLITLGALLSQCTCFLTLSCL